MSNRPDVTEPPSGPFARFRRTRLVIVLGLLSAFGPLSLDMYLPALPALAGDLQTGTSQAQLSLTFCLLGLALGQLLSGPMSDVRGRRYPLFIGLTVYTVSSLLCAYSPNVWVFIALRFIQGLAGAAGIVLSRAIVRDLYSGPELTRFFSLLMLVNGAAPILAPIFGGQLLQWTSWRGVFVVLCCIGAVMLAAVRFGLPETLPADRRSKGGIRNTLATFRKLAGDRSFIGFALAQGLVTAGMFAYIAGSPFVLQDIFGVSPQMFSVIFAMNGLGIIAAGQMTGRLAGKVGEIRLLTSGLGIAFIGGVCLLIAILAGAGLPLILPSLFLVVSSVGIVSTSGTSLALQKYGQSAGSASALLGLLSFIIGGVVSPLVGLGGSGTAVPMGIVIAVAETGAVLCYLLLARGK
ncbi:Bcr/CflA family multidrug efflux MFS transporter [Paenibacillus allorhizosphaerae]|uniref:Bcr/CflA family efflux transporter n=1 Tax=Paenibacillus allorhizosphaerae TaxID=2849866 RepID=A0ABM8VFZ7_9BACL|nr:Bcr/CflA family multidrug efflux MFS transporter [Paenibacillus allorhizosphaerae]CAG7636746.1 Bicyclomycin resistance protein [Paenibacillus allorhizosphaerae]